jgi:hypothetical protein
VRFIIMHQTNAHWEAGAVPGPELLARVGGLLQRMSQAGVLQGAEGLRPSSEGVRLRFAAGACRITPGPFDASNDLPAGFTIVHAEKLDDVIEWTTRHTADAEDVEVDIRPVTEPWDIGLGERPPGVATRRYMVLRKSTPSMEAGEGPSAPQRSALASAIEEATRRGVHVATERMRPGRRGRRYKNSRDGVSVYDGAFAETKELIGGYVIVSGVSLDEADSWAREYIRAVDADDVDLRELE